MTVNMYLHPLTSAAVVVMGNGGIPGLVFTQAINLPLAFVCICFWDTVAVLLANAALKRREV
jgi:bacitracin transport system permease protein